MGINEPFDPFCEEEIQFLVYFTGVMDSRHRSRGPVYSTMMLVVYAYAGQRAPYLCSSRHSFFGLLLIYSESWGGRAERTPYDRTVSHGGFPGG